MKTCHICQKETKSIRSLSKHIRDNHKEISVKEYYDRYLKKDNEGCCVICGKETSFINLGEGYKPTCCHKCGGIYHRRQLKNDDNKNTAFIEKVKANQARIWKERELTDEKKTIIEKVMSTIRVNIEHMSEEERKERFGWMNKLSEEEKHCKVKEILNKSLFKWYAEASEEEKNEVYKKSIKTKVDKGICIDRSNINEWENYKNEVRKITERNYIKYKHIINPHNNPRKRGNKGWHIDHIVSIFDGFCNSISPEIIASPFNLQMLEGSVNNSKNTNSWMTIEELLLKWQDDIIKENIK